MRLLRASEDLLRGLPAEDQDAIRWAVATGANMSMVGQDDGGNVELEFVDREGCAHWVLVALADTSP